MDQYGNYSIASSQPLRYDLDYMTFAVLLWWLRLPEASFQTGWFLESVISALLVVLVLRTRLPFFRSRPGRCCSA